METDFNPLYAPKLYSQIGRAIELNLGSTAADVSETRRLVTDLPKALTPIATQVDGIANHVTTEVDRVAAQLAADQATALGTARDDIKQAIAGQVQLVLTRLDTLTAPATPPLIVSPEAAPLLSLLTQVQTLALDAAPGQIYKGKEPAFKGWIGENVTVHALERKAREEAVGLANAEPELHKRFMNAFTPFSNEDFNDRPQRFADVHVLIADIAEFLS